MAFRIEYAISANSAPTYEDVPNLAAAMAFAHGYVNGTPGAYCIVFLCKSPSFGIVYTDAFSAMSEDVTFASDTVYHMVYDA